MVLSRGNLERGGGWRNVAVDAKRTKKYLRVRNLIDVFISRVEITGCPPERKKRDVDKLGEGILYT